MMSLCLITLKWYNLYHIRLIKYWLLNQFFAIGINLGYINLGCIILAQNLINLCVISYDIFKASNCERAEDSLKIRHLSIKGVLILKNMLKSQFFGHVTILLKNELLSSRICSAGMDAPWWTLSKWTVLWNNFLKCGQKRRIISFR